MKHLFSFTNGSCLFAQQAFNPNFVSDSNIILEGEGFLLVSTKQTQELKNI
mgnify:CR=1 FL=1